MNANAVIPQKQAQSSIVNRKYRRSGLLGTESIPMATDAVLSMVEGEHRGHRAIAL
jgi:hypothetical protein